MPLKQKSKMWYIAHPFTYPVWLLIIISIPVYIITMGLANYVYCRYADWNSVSGFVIRNALSEQNSGIPKHTQVHQAVLITIWLWSVLLLVQSYSGNLTAMLANPTLHKPLRTLEDLLRQSELSWTFEKGSVAEYFTSTAAPDTMLARLFERATVMSPLTNHERLMYSCYSTKMIKSQSFASLCDEASISSLISQDYGRTGKCNFYLLEDKLLASKSSHFAIQVVGIYNPE